VRDPQLVEAELVEIGAIQDDGTKLERLIAWSATHPDEVAFAIRLFAGRSDGIGEWARRHASRPRGRPSTELET
jgi:hypothetical protein